MMCAEIKAEIKLEIQLIVLVTFVYYKNLLFRSCFDNTLLPVLPSYILSGFISWRMRVQ